MQAHVQPGVPPFDAIASDYDDIFSNSRIGRAQRNAVWSELDRHFASGHIVLEINCGTGFDALHLANRGVHVDACDASPGMIMRAQENAAACGLRGVRFWCMPIEQIDALAPEEPYDGVISNFSGLNCVSDLEPVTRNLARLVRPGGRIVVCVFGVFCLWELLWYLGTFRFKKAFRRFSRQGVHAVIAPGATVTVHYRSTRNLERTFAPYFELERRRGVGITVPPSYAESLAVKFTRLFQLAAAVDPILGRCPGVRSMADHIVLTFRRSEEIL
jgi:ubiquinone/menaquinone biosynthesis C-methylase UbiE